MLSCPAPVLSAGTLDEALRMRAANPDATVIAGGTDVMVFLEAGALAPTKVLNIWGCTELRGIEENGSSICIGTLTTWTDVARHAGIPPALAECALTVGGAQIQNRATVGGNIVNASPAGDSLPLFLALDAEFELASIRGRRRVPASDFWTGYRTVEMAQDELLIAVHFTHEQTDRLHYRKVGTRLAQAISKVVLGARLRMDGEKVLEARFALGSVAPTPVRLPSVEAALIGGPIDPEAAGLVSSDISPIDDVRSTRGYRNRVATSIVRSWLEAEAKAQ